MNVWIPIDVIIYKEYKELQEVYLFEKIGQIL